MANRIPQEFINEILARTDIIELIQTRIKITRRGQNHHGLCPFHQEKSPSFSANQSKQFYYCFGCGASGNAIGFVMQYDQLEFRGAVEYLANQLGLELPTDDNDENIALFKKLHAIMQEANHFYQQQLRQSDEAKNYLIARGLTGQIAKTFNIGFVPDGWNHISKHLPSTEQRQLLTQAGMLKQKSDRTYDTFRHRILFPIRNVRGHVVGFGGRSIDQGQPKYLNSPETILFHKNDELFGLFEAKQINKQCSRLVVVEGYMDVISLHQFNITEAVATLGTAINRHHIQKLLRYTNNVIFCFDGDKAGRKAAWKALLASLPLIRDGCCFQFFSIPEGEDPDSLIRTIGSDQFNQHLSDSPEITQVMFNELRCHHSQDSLSGQASLAKEAMGLINTMPEGIYKALVTERLAKELNIKKDTIDATAFAENSAKTRTQPPPPQPPPQQHADELSLEIKFPLSPVLIVTAMLIQYPRLITAVPAQKHELIPSIEFRWLEKIIKTIKKESISETYELFDQIENQYHSILARLASHEFTVPQHGIEEELTGALNRIAEQQSEAHLNELIKKSRISPLSAVEKEQLKNILHLKNKKLLDQNSS